MTAAEEVVRAEIRRHGPIGFDRLVEAALYHPSHGFYATGGQAGRGGDFITSPEVGPLFGAVVARALDTWWRAAGAPPLFVVVEAGAGPGTLARSVLHARPACLAALRYVLVEWSVHQRAQHAKGLHLEEPAIAFASLADPDDEASVETPSGPLVVSVERLPRLTGPCIVLANELLDNLPFGLAERTEDGWAEVKVELTPTGLADTLVPLPPDDDARLGVLAPGAAVGARLPLPRGAAAWVRDAVALAGPGGRVVAFDYAAASADLAARPQAEWLRTYRRHGRGSSPLNGLGTQDLTCEVAVDQLGTAPTSDVAQADWLRAHGIDELVEEGRRVWQERAAIGDLQAVRARSRITEADALLDPAGLGAFRVLEWLP